MNTETAFDSMGQTVSVRGMPRLPVTPAEISRVMAELGRRNKGRPKRMTPAARLQRITAARRPRKPRKKPAPDALGAGAGGGGLPRAQSNA